METQKQIKIDYIFSEGYNPTYVNGAFGGLNPHGEIIINFFFERNALPKSQTYAIKEDGTLGDLIQKEDTRTIVRFVSNGITLNYDSAKAIHEWLGDRIKDLENKLNLKPEGESN